MVQTTKKKTTTKKMENIGESTVTSVVTPVEKTSKKVSKFFSGDMKYLKYGCFALFVVFFAVVFIVGKNITKQVISLQEQQTLLQQQLENSKKIYVFNLEKVVSSSDLVSIQKEFEDETAKLAEEVAAAKKKIKGLKKAKVNEDFSDVYLKALVLKRDELLAKHQKQMDEITSSINDALAEVAKEKGADAVFNYKAISVTSANVIDISDEVITKINVKLREEKDN